MLLPRIPFRSFALTVLLTWSVTGVAQSPPFSAAVWGGDTLYLSGQLGIAPGGGAPVPGGVTAEARQALTNVGQVLTRHGLGFGDVVRCLVVLRDTGDFAAMNEVYREFFAAPFPARSTIGGALVLGANIEIECTAVRKT